MRVKLTKVNWMWEKREAFFWKKKVYFIYGILLSKTKLIIYFVEVEIIYLYHFNYNYL